MAGLIRLSIVTARPRHAALEGLSDAISASGGWIEELHDFAGHAVNLVAGMPGDRVDALLEALADQGLPARAEPFAPATGDRRLTIAVAFAHPDESARRTVPSVPG